MNRLAEEKRLQQKMQAERDKQEREMQEIAMRMERDRREKAMNEKFAVEKEYINKKFNLLNTQLDEESDAASVRSRRDCNPGTSKVNDWINQYPSVTLSANTGNIPTGLTSLSDTSNPAHIDPAMVSVVAGTDLALQTAASIVSISGIPLVMTSSSPIPSLNLSASTTFRQPSAQAPTIQSMQQRPQAPTASVAVMQWNHGRPIPTPLVSSHSLTRETTDNAFVISPTTTMSEPYRLPATAAVSSCMQSYSTQPPAPPQDI